MRNERNSSVARLFSPSNSYVTSLSIGSIRNKQITVSILKVVFCIQLMMEFLQNSTLCNYNIHKRKEITVS